jgi:hypothetical protein
MSHAMNVIIAKALKMTSRIELPVNPAIAITIRTIQKTMGKNFPMFRVMRSFSSLLLPERQR